jgi:hypothetical protein
MVIPHDERTYILTLHEQGRTPEYIAQALIERRALAEVIGVLQDRAAHTRSKEQEQAATHYVYLAPRTPDSEARQPVRVYLHDLPAFCAAHGLKQDRMEQVARGEIDEHRGWTQGPISLYHCPMTARALVVHRKDVEERMKGEAKNKPPVARTYSQQTGPTLLPATTFQPKETAR